MAVAAASAEAKGIDLDDNNDNVILGEGRYLALRRRNRWEFAERPTVSDVAVLIPVTSAGEAVFVEQYREPVQSAIIEWPAGLVGDEHGQDEALMDAANRELEEETGFRARELEAMLKMPSCGGITSEIVTFIRAAGLEKVGNGGGVGHEKITVHCVPLHEVDAWLEEKVREGCWIDPKVYAGLYLLGRERA